MIIRTYWQNIKYNVFNKKIFLLLFLKILLNKLLIKFKYSYKVKN